MSAGKQIKGYTAAVVELEGSAASPVNLPDLVCSGADFNIQLELVVEHHRKLTLPNLVETQTQHGHIQHCAPSGMKAKLLLAKT
jgi:hypothetical protein